ncbi:unnamed protein product [Eruca vesicaria subsp. sativa]|uniref:Uncharacterized protein n=1 Tax=Eruca vesicaria subsp. sativa TaxID=29727 RepID=A0ABC8KEF0_ERUVS|nr:unnamed protein product [Eruca vesicaria subsp. sativa]
MKPSASLDSWSEYFRRGDSDIFRIIDHAIMANRCTGCDNLELSVPGGDEEANDIGDMGVDGGEAGGSKESKANTTLGDLTSLRKLKLMSLNVDIKVGFWLFLREWKEIVDQWVKTTKEIADSLDFGSKPTASMANKKAKSTVFQKKKKIYTYKSLEITKAMNHEQIKAEVFNEQMLRFGNHSKDSQNHILTAARYGGSSMSQWAMSPGRSLEAAHQTSSSLKPPRDKGLGKLLNLRFDFSRRKKKPSSPLKPKTTESTHQLKLMNNQLVQWRFANARESAANNTPSKGNNVIIITSTHETLFQKQLLCAWDALTKLQNLVIQERINL